MSKLRGILLLMLAVAALGSFAQDTVVVSTINYESTTRDTVIEFPDGSESYEKILMLYSMRCKDGLVSDAGNRNRGCGEWDYSCNTYVADSSKIDSLSASTSEVLISRFGGTVFNARRTPIFNYYRHLMTTVGLNTIQTEDTAVLGSSKNNPKDIYLPADKKIARTFLLYTASELTAAGLIAGEIDGLLLPALSGATLNFFRIGIKNTALDSFGNAVELDGFTSVFQDHVSLTASDNRLMFNTPFLWDGQSNIIIALSFNNEQTATSVQQHSTTLARHQSMTATSSNYQNMDGTTYVEATGYKGILGNDARTIDAWIKTSNNNVEIMSWGLDQSLKKWVFRLNDNGTLRVEVNGGQIYGTTDLRDDKWHHVACVFDGTTLNDVTFYVDGILEAIGGGSGNVNVSTTAGVDVRVSRGVNNRYFIGGMDDVRLWTKALTALEVKRISRYGIGATDPLHAFLALSYDFDGGQSAMALDRSGNNRNGVIYGFKDRKALDSRTILKAYYETADRPNLSLVQGDYDSSHNSYYAFDSTMQSSHMVTLRTISKNYNSIRSDDIAVVYAKEFWNADNEAMYFDEDGSNYNSIVLSSDTVFTSGTLNYMRRFPMVFEIMSFVTPYGIGLNLGPQGKTWSFDVTDYTPLLKGKRRFYLSRGGQWQEDMDIKFLFIKGTPSREVLDINQIWPTAIYSPNYNQITDNTIFFPPVNVPLRSDASAFKLRSAITGHGQEGEFIPREHYITLNDDQQEYSRTVWKACGKNPIYPQGGTWIYDRAGWCPGMATDVAEYDITDQVSAGDTVTFDYGVKSGSGDSRYIVNNQLVTYGAHNFQFDAEIVDVINPSIKVEHARTNPMCTAPQVILRNNGSQTMTSAKIEFWVNNKSNSRTYDWAGTIAPNEQMIVDLPIDQRIWSSGGSGSAVFHAEVNEVNGQADEYSNNNHYQSAFDYPEVYPKDIYLLIRANNAPNETKFRITNDWGVTVYERTSMAANTFYRDTVRLGLGCHTLTIDDSGNDGVSFWANNDGAGFVRIMRVGGGVLKTIEPDFGAQSIINFTVEHSLSTTEKDNYGFKCYPNPATDQIVLEAFDLEGADVQILNMMGQAVFVPHTATHERMIFDLSGEAKGMYLLRVSKNGRQWDHKVILQ